MSATGEPKIAGFSGHVMTGQWVPKTRDPAQLLWECGRRKNQRRGRGYRGLPRKSRRQ
ncbi:unnamed protein product [Cuscuta epithymum]|uniref:Uncharacterized protein n=1 Tax=Cuscuta epithymum TaxID=186058 RepID=A0AAV0CM53_9ASTE|nr:unnamed protein product [Cuscuta epithymum]